MARYVDACSLRDKVSESLQDNPHRVDIVARNHNYEHAHFLNLLDNEPTAEVQEVKHGKWAKTLDEVEIYDYVYECSVCGGKEIGCDDDFCPWCGAKMDKE